MSFDVGDRVVITARFADLDGTPANPTEVTLTVLKPDGAAANVTVDNTGTVGEYAGEVTIDQSGDWKYRFHGTGSIAAAEEGTLIVRRQRVPTI